jgi:hypothetical protein
LKKINGFGLYTVHDAKLVELFIGLSLSLSLLQARILALNASYFLKCGGHFVMSIKVPLAANNLI